VSFMFSTKKQEIMTPSGASLNSSSAVFKGTQLVIAFEGTQLVVVFVVVHCANFVCRSAPLLAVYLDNEQFLDDEVPGCSRRTIKSSSTSLLTCTTCTVLLYMVSTFGKRRRLDGYLGTYLPYPFRTLS
jgi:hypothetical protein